MPLGLKMLQDVFQMWMDQITDRLTGIIAIHNDICVYGKDTAECNNNQLKLMQPAQEHGLVFNSSECSICQPQISFYGAIFTVQGMKPDPTKVQVLQDLCTPKPPNNSSHFRLNQLLAALPSKTTFLREQVTNWDWNPSTDQSFHHLKSWICNTLLRTTLAYYDCTQPLVL